MNNYLIFKKNEVFNDIYFYPNEDYTEIILEDYDQTQTFVSVQLKDSMMTLSFENKIQIKLKSIDWKNKPVLQNQFHWMVDGY